MQPIRLKTVLIPRIEPPLLSRSLTRIPRRCFHAGSPARLPNPYSKRPTELPQPADEPPEPPPTDPNHGLYRFFRNKQSLTEPSVLANHGTFTSALR
jgi:hypothetical protein